MTWIGLQFVIVVFPDRTHFLKVQIEKKWQNILRITAKRHAHLQTLTKTPVKDSTGDENVKVVHTLVMCDRRRDLRSMASEVCITNIFGISKVSARLLPRVLADDQKRTPLDISMFLCTSCLAVKIILAILTREL